MDVTGVTIATGEQLAVQGTTADVEQTITAAARGSLMQMAWLTDAATGQPVAVNPDHVLVLRTVESDARPASA